MPLEDDDIEFDELLADSRHKELKNSLKVIANALGKKDNTEIVSALEKQTAAIRGFAEAINQLPAPKVNVQQPNVNIDLSSLKEIADRILEGQEKIIAGLEILNKPKDYKMEFTRGSYSDLIQSPITFKQIK